MSIADDAGTGAPDKESGGQQAGDRLGHAVILRLVMGGEEEHHQIRRPVEMDAHIASQLGQGAPQILLV